MNIDLSNPMYWVLIGLILLEYAWELIRYRLSDSMLHKPLPAEAADIYEPEAYSRWLSYRAEGRRLSVIKGAVFTGLTLALFACSVFALTYYGLGLDRLGEWGGAVLMALYTVFCALVEIPFNYYGTFVIEEKYGFNKSTRKTFWVDFIKSLVLNTTLNVSLVAVAASLFRWQGIWVIVWLFALLTLIMIAASAFSMTFMKLNNKFTPLEDGSLKDRLTALFGSNGYRVGTIWVMDASRRTTRANAFCTGLGRMKKVALFDNLVNNYTDDEITAVFAHELGHAKHRDTTVLTLMQLLIYAVMAACIGWMVSTDTVSAAMGFDGVNVAAVIIALLSVVFEPLLFLLMIPINALSRRMEYDADRFAAENGLGEGLISALKKLSRDNFSNLNPHPFLSMAEDSHPTTAQRIRAIRACGVPPEPNHMIKDISTERTDNIMEQKYYKMNIAGCERALPLCPLNDKLMIGAFVIFGDPELTTACAQALLDRAPEYDYIITAEAKGIPLAHEMARLAGNQKYMLARKGPKLYMRNILDVAVRSITTAKEQHLYLDGCDAELMKGKRILVVDDVISTGESLKSLETLVEAAGGIVCGRCAILAEGDAQERPDLIYLEKLPLFDADGQPL